MERNKLLKIASLACSVLGALQVAGIVILTVILVHWHIDKEFYQNFTVSENGISVKIVTTETVTRDAKGKVLKTTTTDGGKFPKDKVSLAALSPFSLYFSYLKGVVSMLMLFFIFKEFGKVIGSVKAFQTFRSDNIRSFRKIGKYLLILFVLSGFHLIFTEGQGNFSIDFDGTMLILMLVAYILAEIFEEGNKLQEEEKLTI